VQRWVDEYVDLSRLTLYAIPTVLPLSIPCAITFAVLGGAAGERLTRKLRVAIMATAIACSILMFSDLAWVIPESNQAFRTIVFDAMLARYGDSGDSVRQPPVRGAREMSMSELRRQMVLRPNERRRLEFTYHQRWSLSMAPLMLAAFALVLVRFVRQRPARVAFGFGRCLGYWFLLQTAQQAVRIGGSVMLAAWSPNVIIALFIIALSWPLRRLSPAS
jgi:lipopolysaccharide export LptBFGC system permease protein LptF